MRKKIVYYVIVLLIGILGLVLTGCGGGEKENPGTGPAQGDKLKVVVTIYPVYDFAGNIGGDRIDLTCLVPPGAEPHEWEPSPRDLAELHKADVFIYCGAGMEQWVAKTMQAINKPGITMIDAGKNIELITGQEHHHHDHEAGGDGRGADHNSGSEPAGAENAHDHDHDADKAHEDYQGSEEPAGQHIDDTNADPHIWVDPLNAVVMVDNITAGLVQADPGNREYFENNAAAYREQLMALHEDYRKGLAGAKRKEFVTSHAAFGYLAQRYGLVQVPIRGLSPEVEPTPTRMAEVVKLVREKEIGYIFFESLVNPKVSEVIAAETGAETLVLNPVGGLTAEEMEAGKDYLSVMRENLANLQKALGVMS